jgi:hypothetical protein
MGKDVEEYLAEYYGTMVMEEGALLMEYLGGVTVILGKDVRVWL